MTLFLVFLIVGMALYLEFVAEIDPLFEIRKAWQNARYRVSDWILKRRIWWGQFRPWLTDTVPWFAKAILSQWWSTVQTIRHLFVLNFAGFWTDAKTEWRTDSQQRREWLAILNACRPRASGREWETYLANIEAEYRYKNNIWTNGKPPKEPGSTPTE